MRPVTPQRNRTPTDGNSGSGSADAESLAALARSNHDLRSPLSVIMGVLELLRQSTTLSESEQRYVNLGAGAATELLAVADALRLYTSLRQGHLSLARETVDLTRLAQETVSALAASKQLGFTTRVATSDYHPVTADPEYLTLALSSLVTHFGTTLDAFDARALIMSITPGSGPTDLRRTVLQVTVDLPDSTPRDAPEAPSPGIAVLNARHLIARMGGRADVDPELPQLTLALPSVPAES